MQRAGAASRSVPKKRAARGEGRRPEPTGAITDAEAYELLGVSQGCTPEELTRAYQKEGVRVAPGQAQRDDGAGAKGLRDAAQNLCVY